MLLAGDIGGTKTQLAIFSEEEGPFALLAETEVLSADYPSLEAIAEEFLRQTRLPVNRACFDVAGPVLGGQAKVTNLPWLLEEKAMALALKLESVRLINDLQAIAVAVPKLRPQDVETLSAGEPMPCGAIGVVAPGTGLGESFLTWESGAYKAHSSEGGHADFAPTDALQARLLLYLLERFDHVSYERVCSGIGIPNVYDFLAERERIPEHSEAAAAIAAARDRSAVIIDHAFGPDSQCCAATIEVVASILASEAGNLALKVLATGGIYLAGGVAVHCLPALRSPRFLETFRRKGRFTEFMSRIPVHVITGRAALTGAAIFGLNQR